MPRFILIVFIAFFSLFLAPVASHSAEIPQEKEYRQEAILELQQLREDNQDYEEKMLKAAQGADPHDAHF